MFWEPATTIFIFLHNIDPDILIVNPPNKISPTKFESPVEFITQNRRSIEERQHFKSETQSEWEQSIIFVIVAQNPSKRITEEIISGCGGNCSLPVITFLGWEFTSPQSMTHTPLVITIQTQACACKEELVVAVVFFRWFFQTWLIWAFR